MSGAPPASLTARRRAAVMAAAERTGMLAGQRTPVSARVATRLMDAVKAQTGLTSTADILEYALAKVAVEDDYGARLLALEGTVDPDLEF